MYEIFILAMRLAESFFIPLHVAIIHHLRKDEKILDPLTAKEGRATWFWKGILDVLYAVHREIARSKSRRPRTVKDLCIHFAILWRVVWYDVRC